MSFYRSNHVSLACLLGFQLFPDPFCLHSNASTFWILAQALSRSACNAIALLTRGHTLTLSVPQSATLTFNMKVQLLVQIMCVFYT